MNENKVIGYFMVGCIIFGGLCGVVGYNVMIEPVNLQNEFNRGVASVPESNIVYMDNCNERFSYETERLEEDLNWFRDMYHYSSNQAGECYSALRLLERDINFFECSLSYVDSKVCINSNLVRCTELKGIVNKK